MLIVSNSPFNLVRYHVQTNNDEGRKVKIFRSSSIKDVTDILLEGIDYDDDGNLIKACHIIYYTGENTLSDFKMNSYNLVYLVVENISKWGHLKQKKYEGQVEFLSIKPTQYRSKIDGVQAVMSKETYAYFWSEYCIKKFKSDPQKWYNEVRYLMFKYQEIGRKFTPNDLDCIYHKVSDNAKEYIKYMYTKGGKEYINNMTANEKFVVFVAAKGRKSLVQRNLEQYKPNFLYTYMLFKEAVYAAKIRVNEAVYILHYLLNKESPTNLDQITNLFNLK